MTHPITNLAGAQEALGTYLESPGATALCTHESWVYKPRRKWLRARTPVLFPYPASITDVEEAQQWAELAEDVTAEEKAHLTLALLVLPLLLSATLISLTVGLAGIQSGSLDSAGANTAQGLAFFVGIAALLAMFLFRRGPWLAPVWERRAAALRGRAEELAAALIPSPSPSPSPSAQARSAQAPPEASWRTLLLLARGVAPLRGAAGGDQHAP